jgi:hypothetical protein
MVTPLFRSDPDVALRVLTTRMPEQAYRNLRPLVRVFPAFYRFRHRISDGALEDRMEGEREGRPYLVGDTFPVADLTAGALLSPVLQPAEMQYPLQVELPPHLQEYRAGLMRHRLHRERSARAISFCAESTSSSEAELGGRPSYAGMSPCTSPTHRANIPPCHVLPLNVACSLSTWDSPPRCYVADVAAYHASLEAAPPPHASLFRRFPVLGSWSPA